jgi:Tfp pilus assembly PilM family ATPase
MSIVLWHKKDKYLKHMFNPIDPITHLDSKDSKTSWREYLIKPAIMLVGFIAIGYATTWLSVNFVKQDRFAEFVQKQIESDKKLEEQQQNRWELTQQKLETIINQQTAYTEQLKAYNQVMLGIQKQVDNLDDRVKYIERLHNPVVGAPTEK